MDLKAQTGARKARVSLTYKQRSRRKRHTADNQYTVKQRVRLNKSMKDKPLQMLWMRYYREKIQTWSEWKMKPTEHPTNKEYYLNQRTDCTLKIMGRKK